MIPRTRRAGEPAPWQQALAGAVRDPAELLALLRLPRALLPAARTAARRFPLRVPRGFVARMRPGDPDDPLLRQVLPLEAELAPQPPGYGPDPVGDDAASCTPGLLRKYRDRALLVTTGACAVHCRYCFRRHYPYAEASAGPSRWRAIVEHLAGDGGTEEVILSGGDPLTLPTPRLAALTRTLCGVPGLARLRIHTRLPVVLPERVDGELLAWLARLPWQVVVVVHANHANELDDDVAAALAALAGTGAVLLNQSVLLAGVNDDTDVLAALSRRLLACGVLPYYLHQLDRVAGAAHFAVDDARARDLHARLRERLPGYLVPRLVREVAGAPAKMPL